MANDQTPGPGRRLGQLALAAGSVSLALLFGCGGTPATSRSADPPRASTPIPACSQALHGREASGGTLKGLKEDEYWALVFPEFDTEQERLPPQATACTGRDVFADPVFAGGEASGQVAPGDTVFGGGGSRLKLVWLRTHRFPDGSRAGPLAIVRASGDVADVFAVGAHRGPPGDVFLRVERLGPDIMAVVEHPGCQEREPGKPCDSELHFYLPWEGVLAKSMVLAPERVRYREDGEPGMQGPVEYHLVTTRKAEPWGVLVLEQISVKDVSGRELRRLEQESQFLRKGEKLEPTLVPLWERLFSEGAGAKEPAGEPKKRDAPRPEASDRRMLGPV